jgi:hypothetical protein
MLRATTNRSAMSKEVVPDEPCDPPVEIVGDLKGKVDHVKIPGLNLTNSVLFPHMHTTIF